MLYVDTDLFLQRVRAKLHKKHQSATVQIPSGTGVKNLPCIDYTAAGFLPNKLFLFNINDIHSINRTAVKFRDWHRKHQTTQYPVKWFLIYFFIFLLFFPSEMTFFFFFLEMVTTLPPCCSPVCGLICHYAGICWFLWKGRTHSTNLAMGPPYS